MWPKSPPELNHKTDKGDVTARSSHWHIPAQCAQSDYFHQLHEAQHKSACGLSREATLTPRVERATAAKSSKSRKKRNSFIPCSYLYPCWSLLGSFLLLKKSQLCLCSLAINASIRKAPCAASGTVRQGLTRCGGSLNKWMTVGVTNGPVAGHWPPAHLASIVLTRTNCPRHASVA